MPILDLLVSTWDDGVFAVTGDAVRHELAGESVRCIVGDGRGGVLAVVGGHSLRRRSSGGAWTTLATSEAELSCCVPVGDRVFGGTDDARVLRVDADGAQRWMSGFDAVPGRETWYAGSAIVDGKVMGPPLGVRSMTATCDGNALVANVHVGGAPRSTDGGVTWHPTIDIESDVHQVCAHRARPEIVIAAAGAGLCISRDAAATWAIEEQGLHARHCTGVALGTTDLFVSASTDQFAAHGAVYRRAIDGGDALQPLGGGFPRWTDGIVDTRCIAARDAAIAVADRSGRVYASDDGGASWTSPSDRLPAPSGVQIL